MALILGLLTGLAAFFGGVMSASYLLAGTVSANPVLFILETWLVLAWRVAGWWGLDRWLLRWMGSMNRGGDRGYSEPSARSRSLTESTMRHSVLLFLLVLSPTLARAQQFTHPGRITNLSMPVAIDTTGLFRAAADRVGDDVFIAGQPTEQGLREMKARGVTTIVNLRTPEEMRSVKFDEAALTSQLGMKYVYLPVRGDAKYPYSPETVTKFAEAVQSADGKVLLHCTIAWRASHLWAAYLIEDRGVPVDEALANARAINLMDTHRMGTGGKQPVEEFLGRALPTLGRPSGGR